jgi:hypothetical protein
MFFSAISFSTGGILLIDDFFFFERLVIDVGTMHNVHTSYLKV